MSNTYLKFKCFICIFVDVDKKEINHNNYEKNKDKIKKRILSWRKANPDKIKTYQKTANKNYYWNHKEEEKERQRNLSSGIWGKKWRRRIRKSIKHKLFTLLGGKCVNCPENDFDCLQLDHPNNDGYLKRRDGRYWSLSWMRELIKTLN